MKPFGNPEKLKTPILLRSLQVRKLWFKITYQLVAVPCNAGLSVSRFFVHFLARAATAKWRKNHLMPARTYNAGSRHQKDDNFQNRNNGSCFIFTKKHGNNA